MSIYKKSVDNNILISERVNAFSYNREQGKDIFSLHLSSTLYLKFYSVQ